MKRAKKNIEKYYYFELENKRYNLLIVTVRSFFFKELQKYFNLKQIKSNFPKNIDFCIFGISPSEINVWKVIGKFEKKKSKEKDIEKSKEIKLKKSALKKRWNKYYLNNTGTNLMIIKNCKLCLIDYCSEGTKYIENVQVYIQTFSEYFNIKKENIRFLTMNNVGTSDTIKYYNYCWGVCNELLNKLPKFKNVKKTHKFLLLGGYPRTTKMIAIFYLYVNKILDYGLWSFGDLRKLGKPTNTFIEEIPTYKLFKDLEILEKEHYNTLLKKTPKILDVLPSNKQLTRIKFPIDLYEQVYFSIILETEFRSKNHGITRYTEKTCKVFLIPQPFVIFGTFNVLKLLKEDGFKTFSPYINEDYDNIDNLEERKNALIKEIKRLCSLSKEEWDDLNYNLKEIYNHNKNIIMNNIIRNKKIKPIMEFTNLK